MPESASSCFIRRNDGSLLELTTATVIGSDPSCDVVVTTDRFVEPQHVEIVPTNGYGILVRPLFAANADGAFYLNGDRGWDTTVAGHGDKLILKNTGFELFERHPVDPREEKFLATLARFPADEAHRAVYADWLESAGRTAEAELLRIPAAQYGELASRIRELAPAMPFGWRRFLLRAPIERCQTPDCPRRWHELTPVDRQPKRRECSACHHHVFFAAGVASAHVGRLTYPVVLDVVEERHEGDVF